MPTKSPPSLAPVGALEAKLRATPEDWESWLVYADYLLEQGDARGRWLVLQHRLESYDLADKERREVRAQLLEIDRPDKEAAWLAGYRSLKGTAYTWRCGFVVGVRLPWKKSALKRLEALVSQPSARFLASLDLSHQPVGDQGVEALVRSRAFQRLHTLKLYNSNVGDRGACAIAAAESQLHTLDLQLGRISDTGAHAIAQSPHLSGLRLLHLWDNRIGAASQASLASSKILRNCTIYAKRQRTG